MTLIKLFREDGFSFTERPSFTSKSLCEPPKGNPSLELFLIQIEKELSEGCKSNLSYSNFSKEEWQCVSFLANDRSILIKKETKVRVWLLGTMTSI